MWTKEIFGTDVYHLIAAFLLYSMIGWFLESAYITVCNKKLTNRGFAKGPFCPIYGVGAVCCYLIMGPMRGHYLKIYFLGAFLATLFEFLVGKAMIRFLGALWWDYNRKAFNYQGIICLESTIAWGFYALGVVYFVHDWVYRIIDSISFNLGLKIVWILLMIVTIDYIMQLRKVFRTKS